MSIRTAGDLMVPIDQFPRLRSGAPLAEAVRVMQEVECPMGMLCSRHHSVIVEDQEGQVLGWVGMRDVLMSLDPRYHTRKGLETIRTHGVNADQIRQLVESFGADQSPLQNICQKAGSVLVDDLLYRPAEDERIDVDATLDEVVTHLVNGARPMLLVTRDSAPAGVLRLEDVFETVSDAIRSCKI